MNLQDIENTHSLFENRRVQTFDGAENLGLVLQCKLIYEFLKKTRKLQIGCSIVML